MDKRLWLNLACGISLCLSGCASVTTQKEDLFPAHGKTMKDVYQAQTGALDRPPVVLPEADARLDADTRRVAHEIQHLFPHVPNPGLVIYIDPHLSPGGIPIPGYATRIPLYRRNYYALPGEPTQSSGRAP